MDPKSLALQAKAQLETLGFAVDPQGNVSRPGSGGGFFPPWSWAPALTDDPAQRSRLATPASDPSSPWRASVGYDSGGPFTNHSQWDSSKGTYEGGIDWGTLLGTIGVGSLFAAPAIAGALGGGASAGPLASGETGMAATSAAMTPPASLAAEGGGSALGAATAGASASAPWVKALATLAGTLGGHAIGSAAQSGAVPPQLSQLLDLSLQRQQQQQPLGQAVDQGIYQMLPNFARTGTSMPNVPTDASGGLTALLGRK